MISPADQARRVSTGEPALDRVLDQLRLGDNVVWRVHDLDDYRHFIRAFTRSANDAGRDIIYLRFGQHAPLLTPGPGVRRVDIDARDGFESFTARVWQEVETWGRGAFYVCDCLSDLLDVWATDTMVGYFFRVICPRLYELDTVAWFALLPHRHAHPTLDRIRTTTQVLIDVYRTDQHMQVQPVKVWQRQSPTMFLPHHYCDGELVPVTDSHEATRLQAALEQQAEGAPRLLDGWDRLFWEAGQCAAQGDSEERVALTRRILQVLVSREPRLLALAERYLSLEDLIAIHKRTIGSGYIGGKATGMLLARAILQRDDTPSWCERLDPHDSLFLATDAWYAFLVHNGLWAAVMRQRTQAGFFAEAPDLRRTILAGELPPEVRPALARALEHFGQYPILIRSSSLLEDGFGNAFAGKYESVFLVNKGSPEERLNALENAIRQVYASRMHTDALSYRRSRQLEHLEEPMALLIQRVNGRFHGRWYLPDAAAVGASRNTFVWDRKMDPQAGMLRLVVGLGTRAVDRIEGDHARVLALDYPLMQPFRSREESYRFTQQQVDVLDLSGRGLHTLDVGSLIDDAPDLPWSTLAEVDREASERARNLGLTAPVRRLTFQSLLRSGQFVALTRKLLSTLEQAYAHPVDVEFTLQMDANCEPRFNLVQCRPLATIGESAPVALPQEVNDRQLLLASEGHFMGGNINLTIDQVIRVRAEPYSDLSQAQKYQLATLIGQLSQHCPAHQRLMLIGPGRWGTSSPELGIPVGFADINRVAVLVEVADMGNGMVPDLSYGSHFFQDLVETGIAYIALFPGETGSVWQPEWLNRHAHSESVSALLPGAEPALLACLELWLLPDAKLQVLADVEAQRLLAGNVQA